MPTLAGQHMEVQLGTLAERAAVISRAGFTWWKWSASYALLIGVLELLILIGLAVLGHIEFAVLAMYFVAAATGIALIFTGVLILVWLVLISAAPVLATNRSWMVLYIVLLSFPLYFSPVSIYEFALAAPTILGFFLPRFFVSCLRHVVLHTG